MLNQSEPACLVIADITGYTSYLAGVELDHAQDILADLIDTVVGALRPTFRLAKLEGDAAFTYVDHRDRRRLGADGHHRADAISRSAGGCATSARRRSATATPASGCPSLDLKLLAHHGTILRQRMAGREELVGSPVIVAHRLLKNAVTETTGLPRLRPLHGGLPRGRPAIDDPAALGLVEHREEYDHLGEVDRLGRRPRGRLDGRAGADARLSSSRRRPWPRSTTRCRRRPRSPGNS